jgi:hypothetical protein
MFLLPSQFILDLVAVYRVPPVMAGAVRHKSNQIAVPIDVQRQLPEIRVVFDWIKILQYLTDPFYYVDVLFFALAADIGFPRPLQDQPIASQWSST